MKKILLSIMIMAVMGITAKVQAQCTLQNIANIKIQVVGVPTPGPGANQCTVTFNAEFDIATNSGFKNLYFHSWLAADYPVVPIFNCGGSTPAVNPGTATQLGTVVDAVGKSFMDLGFTNVPTTGALNVVQPLTFATIYPEDNTVVLTQPSNSPGLTAEKFFNGTNDHYTVKNIKVILNQPCGGPVSVKTDIWGSNQNAPKPAAQCYVCAQPIFFNDPTITGFKNCASPSRQYTLGISTVDPSAKNITYKIYVDVNSNGTLEIGTDELAFSSAPISLSSGTPFSSGGPVSLPPPYSNTQPYSEYGYLILVEGPSLSNSVVKFFPHPAGCIGLPVDFKSFTATRSKSNVMVKWVTSTEINNSGFAVERNVNGTWEQVAFVPSQAPNGNSSSDLSYQYIDLNNTKGISQYRIKQVDIDSKSKYSDIRSVKGDGQIGKIIVYPNPTADGKVNVVFDDASVTRTITVSDMSGRTVKQISGISNNNITIDNLLPGVYSLRVFVPETGEQSVMKVVVNKR